MKKLMSILLSLLLLSFMFGCEEQTKAPTLISKITVEDSLKIRIGSTYDLKATITPEDATDKTLLWSSDKPDTVSVDEKGKLTALKHGKATITVKSKDGNAKATCSVEVTPQPIQVESLSFKISTYVLQRPKDLSQYLTVTPANAESKLTWTSSDPNILKIDADTGKAESTGVGSVTVTVKSDNGKEASLTVKTEAKVMLNDDEKLSLYEGQCIDLRDYLKVYPSNMEYTIIRAQGYDNDDDKDKIVVLASDGYSLIAKKSTKSGSTVQITIKTTEGDEYPSKKTKISISTAFDDNDQPKVRIGEELKTKRLSPDSIEYIFKEYHSEHFTVVDGKLMASSSGIGKIEYHLKNGDDTLFLGSFPSEVIAEKKISELNTATKPNLMEKNRSLVLKDNSGSDITTGIISSNPDIISIDGNGMLNALKTGLVDITVNGTTYKFDVVTLIPQEKDIISELRLKNLRYVDETYILAGSIPEGFMFQGDGQIGIESRLSQYLFELCYNGARYTHTPALDITRFEIPEGNSKLAAGTFKHAQFTEIILPEIDVIEKNAFKKNAYLPPFETIKAPSSMEQKIKDSYGGTLPEGVTFISTTP